MSIPSGWLSSSRVVVVFVVSDQNLLSASSPLPGILEMKTFLKDFGDLQPDGNYKVSSGQQAVSPRLKREEEKLKTSRKQTASGMQF